MSLPAVLLRPLTLLRAVETPDETDGTVTTTWQSLDLVGRIGRGRAGETGTNGRQASTAAVRLFTNDDGIRRQDRIVDGVKTWEVAGTPARIVGSSGVHHWEAPLRRVVG